VKEGFIEEAEAQRIYRLISDLELSLWHPILDDYDVVWESQMKMTQKRGGNLCAPVPKGTIGACGYINDVPRSRLEAELAEYKATVNCSAFPREGKGIDPHCADVGLEHPGTTGVSKKAESSDSEDGLDTETRMDEMNRLWGLTLGMVEKSLSQDGKSDAITSFVERVKQDIEKVSSQL